MVIKLMHQSQSSVIWLQLPCNDTFDEVMILLLAESVLGADVTEKILSSCNDSITTYFQDADADGWEPHYAVNCLPDYFIPGLISLLNEHMPAHQGKYQETFDISLLGYYRIHDEILVFGDHPGFIRLHHIYEHINSALPSPVFCIDQKTDYTIYSYWYSDFEPGADIGLASGDKTVVVDNK